ncbi:MAG TPA: hypothetical protein VHO69_16565 [Phototrophicaceae bacterium]|nr:hypothetical protein [Phototrophicaceae bacterium]
MAERPLEDLLVALEALAAQWDKRSKEADAKALNLSRIGASQSELFRGKASAYLELANELRALLANADTEAEAEPVQYAEVSKDTAQTVLKLAGLSAAELHVHKDKTFSIIFLPLQFRSVQEVSDKLLDVADVVILDHGRLSNTNKSFVDFAFKTPPT